MAIKKTPLKSKPECKLRFELLADEIGNAETVCIVGSFNNWDEDSHPMTKRSGKFSLTMNLPKDERVEFRYLVDGSRWLNDPDADESTCNGFGDAENSVLNL